MSNSTPAVRSLSSFQTTEIRQLFAQARLALKVPGLEIRTSPAHKPFGRILVVVPRRVGSAPQRNLIKRRLKALFYENRIFEHKKDFLIFVTADATHLTFAQLRALMRKVVES